MKHFDTSLYFITDSTMYEEEEFLRRVEAALQGGVTIMQIREKNKSTRAYIDLAEKVHALTKRYGVPLIIDDRVDVALAVNAEGVHLGAEDMTVAAARKILGEDKIIGATAKTVSWALDEAAQGADYLGVGAIYPTTTKDNIDVLAGIPISGVCAVSAIMKADDPKKAAEELKARAQELGLTGRKGEQD